MKHGWLVMLPSVGHPTSNAALEKMSRALMIIRARHELCTHHISMNAFNHAVPSPHIPKGTPAASCNTCHPAPSASVPTPWQGGLGTSGKSGDVGNVVADAGLEFLHVVYDDPRLVGSGQQKHHLRALNPMQFTAILILPEEPLRRNGVPKGGSGNERSVADLDCRSIATVLLLRQVQLEARRAEPAASHNGGGGCAEGEHGGMGHGSFNSSAQPSGASFDVRSSRRYRSHNAGTEDNPREEWDPPPAPSALGRGASGRRGWRLSSGEENLPALSLETIIDKSPGDGAPSQERPLSPVSAMKASSSSRAASLPAPSVGWHKSQSFSSRRSSPSIVSVPSVPSLTSIPGLLAETSSVEVEVVETMPVSSPSVSFHDPASPGRLRSLRANSLLNMASPTGPQPRLASVLTLDSPPLAAARPGSSQDNLHRISMEGAARQSSSFSTSPERPEALATVGGAVTTAAMAVAAAAAAAAAAAVATAPSSPAPTSAQYDGSKLPGRSSLRGSLSRASAAVAAQVCMEATDLVAAAAAQLSQQEGSGVTIAASESCEGGGLLVRGARQSVMGPQTLRTNSCMYLEVWRLGACFQIFVTRL